MRAEQDTGKPIPDEAFLELDRHIVNYSFYPEVQVMAANMYPSLIRSEFSQLQYAAFLRLIIEAPEDGGWKGIALADTDAYKDRPRVV
jgi:hypothetical protein